VEDLRDEAVHGAVGGVDREGLLGHLPAAAAVPDGTGVGGQGGVPGAVELGGVVEEDGGGDGLEAVEDGDLMGGEEVGVGGLGGVEQAEAGIVVGRIGQAGRDEPVPAPGGIDEVRAPAFAPGISEVEVGEEDFGQRPGRRPGRHGLTCAGKPK
jgi:hypothetical protein